MVRDVSTQAGDNRAPRQAVRPCATTRQVRPLRNIADLPSSRFPGVSKSLTRSVVATPERERWIVQTESFYDACVRLYLELAAATARGMAILTRLVG